MHMEIGMANNSEDEINKLVPLDISERYTLMEKNN